jgi:hypothetical protein
MGRSAFALATLGLLAAVGGAAAAGDSNVSLQSLKGYQEIASSGNWALYFKGNSLDIWRGNVPYEKLKNGHAWFAVTWKHPVAVLPGERARAARSAYISYVFSCSEPIESYFAKVVFYDTPFVPLEDTFFQQWRATWRTVHVVQSDEIPERASWIGALDPDSLGRWKSAWSAVYQRACRS